ncbi:MAG: phenylalanine--tRNA ligase subunit beta, partial [Bacteroidota bacterium]
RIKLKMKISYNWLKHYLNIKQSPAEVAALLTNGGLEVEGVEEWQSLKGGLKGIVIGEIKECVRHPNADRLSVCKVDTGSGEPRQIVCGAPNVAAGQKVVVALPGATLYPAEGESFEIKKSKIRGEASEGMICAEDEIGLGHSHAGIIVLPDDVKPGSLAADFYGVETDYILEIGLTPNRSDAASHIGVARDLKAILSLKNKTELIKPDVTAFKATSEDSPVKVIVNDTEGCQRYSGLYIKNLVVKDSPAWLQNRLKAIGLRPINNIVDVTNYVMMETGQPMHAFDASKIKGNVINVQQLPAGSVFKTLDGVERKLNGTEMMICNESEGMCIAGVFGGIDSGVTATTTAVFLESAYFNPVSVRKTARLHGLHTDSSFRFERGTDPDGTVYALKRAALLLNDIAGGEVASSVTDIYNKKVDPFKVDLKYDYLFTLAGCELPHETVKNILLSLDISIISEDEKGLQLEVPPFKTDVTRPADVVEEIIRIYGYNAIPLPEKISMSMPVFDKKNAVAVSEKISTWLEAAGFREILNNSITSGKYAEMSGGAESMVTLLNPLSSDLSVMRSTLLFSGLETILYNMNRKQDQLMLFESGKTYIKKEAEYIETNRYGIWLAGKRYEDNWQKIAGENDIYFLKGTVSAVINHCGVDGKKIHLEEATDTNFELLLSYLYKGKEIARLGKVSRAVLNRMDISSPVFYADINFDELLKCISVKDMEAKEPSKFPEVRRDLSMILDRSVTYSQVEQAAYHTESKLLRNISLFDIYEGEKLGSDKKSYALSFVLADDEATLQDKQIDQVMNKLMKTFEQKLGAVIRKQ